MYQQYLTTRASPPLLRSLTITASADSIGTPRSSDAGWRLLPRIGAAKDSDQPVWAASCKKKSGGEKECQRDMLINIAVMIHRRVYIAKHLFTPFSNCHSWLNVNSRFPFKNRKLSIEPSFMPHPVVLTFSTKCPSSSPSG